MTTANDLPSPPSPTEPARWVLLVQEARTRGFRNALAFRRWCRKHKITIVTEGRFQWVGPADVDRALDALSAQGTPSESAPPSGEAAVASAVTTLMMQKKTR